MADQTARDALTSRPTPDAPEGSAAPAQGPTEPPASRPDRIAEAVADSGERLADTLRPAVGVVGPLVDRVKTDAGHRLPRRRRLRRQAALPCLFEVHPDARDAPVREVGLEAIPLDEIVGTAVEGPAQRGLDFLPLPAFRSANWNGRWKRILSATQQLQMLPPIDVLATADGYWITDGHNRVAAARANGQLAIDAVVRAVMLPGERAHRPPGSLAPVLAESDQVKAAGRGLLTPGATLGREGVSHATREAGDAEPPHHDPGAGAQTGDDVEAPE
jgi:hypothetical protein